MDSKIIGKNIRQHREERHWTQEELAIISGVDARTIQRAESGQNLALETIKAIANAFETTVDQLSKGHQEAALAEFRAKYSVIDLQPVEKSADLCRLFGTHAFHFHTAGTFTEGQADAIAELEQELKDYGDIWSDLEPLQRRQAEKHIQPLIQQMVSLDLALSAGSHSMMVKFTEEVAGLKPNPKPFSWSIMYVAVVPGQQPLRALVREKGVPIQLA